MKIGTLHWEHGKFVIVPDSITTPRPHTADTLSAVVLMAVSDLCGDATAIRIQLDGHIRVTQKEET